MNSIEVLFYNSEHPTLFLGGGKDTQKLVHLFQILSKPTDIFLTGGGASYTFLHSRLIPVGNSDIDREQISPAFQVIDKISFLNKQVFLPIDHIAADGLEGKIKRKHFKKEIPQGYKGIDIGSKTISLYKEKIKKAKSIIWFGSMAAYPDLLKSNSNEILLTAILKSSAHRTLLGLEVIEIVKEAGMLEKFNSVIEDENQVLNFSLNRT